MKSTYKNLVTGINKLSPVNPLLLRITAGIVMFPHGAQLLLGWFGGPGLSNSIQLLMSGSNLPWLLAVIVIMVQFFGSVFLLAGFFTRFSAFSMFIIFIGMIFSGHIEHGFFMNWFGNQRGEGFEFHLLMLGICASLIISGGGKYSVGQLLKRAKSNQNEH